MKKNYQKLVKNTNIFKIVFLPLLLTILLITSTPVIAQKDSTICIPKSQAIEIVSDLEKGDECAERAIVQDSTINVLNAKVQTKDSTIVELRKIETSYKKEVKDREEKSSTQTEQLDFMTQKWKKVKTQKNLIIIGGCVVSVGLVIGVIALAL